MNKLPFLHKVIHLINDLFFPRNFSRSAASQFGHNEGKGPLGITTIELMPIHQYDPQEYSVE